MIVTSGGGKAVRRRCVKGRDRQREREREREKGDGDKVH